MLRRARHRLRSPRPRFLAADLTRLPFPDASFDCVTCGYVLEHLPDARLGLGELARVMMPGARMLLLTTEDNFSGAWTSRVWCCRTYNRQEFRRICEGLGPPVAAGAVVYADAQDAAGRRHLRGAGQGRLGPGELVRGMQSRLRLRSECGLPLAASRVFPLDFSADRGYENALSSSALRRATGNARARAENVDLRRQWIVAAGPRRGRRRGPGGLDLRFLTENL